MIFRRRKPPASPPTAGQPGPDPVQIAIGYHQRTRHGPQAFAASLGFLDWDNQPDPFRRFESAELLTLDQPAEATPTYDALFQSAAAADPISPRSLGRTSLSSFLFHSMALSAWKSAGDARWPLRVNPSSGNLHPTEAYLLLPSVADLTPTPGLHHYAPREHGLERRATWEPPVWAALADQLPAGAFLFGLSSVPWRESWKYGERAWRYCQHDVGHALGALTLAARLQGWRVAVAPTADKTLAAWLGLDRREDFHPAEPEHPDLLAVVFTDASAQEPHDFRLPDVPPSGSSWSGPANILSPEHQPWPIIDVVTQACRRAMDVVGDGVGDPSDETPGEPSVDAPDPALTPHPLAGPLTALEPREPKEQSEPRTPIARPVPQALAGRIIRQRRSAVAMDGRTSLPLSSFERMLARLVPSLCPTPWDVQAWPSSVHLGLFVHRVEGLPPGLYALVRTSTVLPELRDALAADFLWEQPAGVDPALPLFLLKQADVRRTSSNVSCGQDIAADGAFSLGMFARFQHSLTDRGATAYRELFWETGLIGQLLYLEAEACGLSATGIGCFFDESVHACFGLRDPRFQSLYHFTVGAAVHDDRITSEPAYPASRSAPPPDSKAQP
jgi:SagB-type dehydrogenase family enzyme